MLSFLLVRNLGAAAAMSFLPGQTGQKLIVNGVVASTDVRTISGSTYVKLSDVAKAMGMVVVKHADGFELTRLAGPTRWRGCAARLVTFYLTVFGASR